MVLLHEHEYIIQHNTTQPDDTKSNMIEQEI